MGRHLQRSLALAVLAVAARRALSDDGGPDAELRGSGDPVEFVQLIRPAPASVETSPATFLVEVSTTDFAAYKVEYANKWTCVIVDSLESTCVPLMGIETLRLRLPEGEHSARAFIADTEIVTTETKPQFLSDPISFSVVSPSELAEHKQSWLALERARIGAPADQSLLDWASELPTNQSMCRDSRSCSAGRTPAREAWQEPADPAFLVIGVKTRTVDGFPFRQAIRQTWGDAASLPPGVVVLFIGCRLPVQPDQVTFYAMNEALELEKRAFGDLLTDELDCDDGYPHLANKVKQFMHLAATHARYRVAKYVMIADDDIYLHVSAVAADLRLLGESKEVYAGSSLAKHFLRPVRDDRLRYFVSESVYPMESFPPFALGPHYLLSMDCVAFIAENRDELQGLGALDDVSVALWMLAIQVHPQHVDQFRSLRNSQCRDDLLSLADLSPMAMHLVHDNLRRGLSLCHGVERALWDKQNVASA